MYQKEDSARTVREAQLAHGGDEEMERRFKVHSSRNSKRRSIFFLSDCSEGIRWVEFRISIFVMKLLHNARVFENWLTWRNENSDKTVAIRWFRPWWFPSKCNKLFRSVREICLIHSILYPSRERNNSLFLERNDHKNQTVARRIVKISFGCESV